MIWSGFIVQQYIYFLQCLNVVLLSNQHIYYFETKAFKITKILV